MSRWTLGFLRLVLVVQVTLSTVQGARFALEHGSLDGGGSSALAGPFAFENSFSSIVRGSPVNLLHDPPATGRDVVEIPGEGPLEIPISSLLGNDGDVEGNVLQLTLPRTNSVRGGMVTITNGVVRYIPPPAPDTGGDSFSYLATDAFGSSSIGRVTIAAPGTVPRLVSFQRAGASIALRFHGLPTTAYFLQARRKFEQGNVWSDFPSSAAPNRQSADGSGDVEFTVPVAGTGHLFFRLASEESLREELLTTALNGQLKFVLRGVPNTLYKLQYLPAIQEANGWVDYPSGGQPLIVQAASDGFYDLTVPIVAGQGFFRTVARER